MDTSSCPSAERSLPSPAAFFLRPPEPDPDLAVAISDSRRSIEKHSQIASATHDFLHTLKNGKAISWFMAILHLPRTQVRRSVRTSNLYIFSKVQNSGTPNSITGAAAAMAGRCCVNMRWYSQRSRPLAGRSESERSNSLVPLQSDSLKKAVQAEKE